MRAEWLTLAHHGGYTEYLAYLKECFVDLQAIYIGSVLLHLSAENMLDKLFEEQLERNDLLPLGANDDHLLVETTYFNPPIDLSGMLKRIKSKGYHPILAYPERYVYMGKADYHCLNKMRVKLQMNLLSLIKLMVIRLVAKQNNY